MSARAREREKAREGGRERERESMAGGGGSGGLQAVLHRINSKELSAHYRRVGASYSGPASGRARTEATRAAASRSALEGLIGRYAEDYAGLGFPLPPEYTRAGRKSAPPRARE